ncbi:methionine adenosyltransferase [Microvirga makkahensis]|uniref:S-adenosylmethionine synthase n=1 Tax=Microvirga makkahensis TaxID=1128670 RepID=A0A7X3SMX3_9HYPH|nr:methionine adenosyltransferase [Microvirga makkahensis]MXQ10700.1 methionine adenosyltransferase [Microvirga makkahensis]
MLDANDFLFTSESVSEGHPDKVCDQISDAILDAYLRADPDSRVGLETLCTKNTVVLAGEVRSAAQLDSETLKDIARRTVRSIGYDFPGFDWRSIDISVLVHSQSPDIARGVDAGDRRSEGAGDQGMMFGYACDETPELMPAPIVLAHQILRNLAAARKSGRAAGLLPDAKSQVTVRYERGKPVGVDTVVVSTHHRPDLSQNDVRELVLAVLDDTVRQRWEEGAERVLINPTGRFVVGGPESDTGLTGRKIIVDTYGGAALHGGGAFSGKDPTKVDRSGAYAARHLAKNVVAAGLADRCLIQISYAIGVPEPVSIYVQAEGSDPIPSERIGKVIRENVDLTPRGIIDRLQLARPIYQPTATYGHFGRAGDENGSFPWERLDLVDLLRRAI